MLTDLKASIYPKDAIERIQESAKKIAEETIA